MLEITFYRDSRERLSRVFARGHAGWAVRGEDLACAAASAVLQAAQLGLQEHARAKLAVRRRAGELSLRWPEPMRNDVAVIAIVRTAELAIVALAEQFPTHVSARRRRERN